MSELDDFRAGQKRVTLEGVGPVPLRMAYTDTGSGAPVMLLHGIPTWSYLYHDVIPLLSPHRRVIAPDFLGHGYSDRRDCFDRSLRAQATAVLRLMDRLELERVTLVGHDTGGGVALILGIEHPDRLERLVLSNVVAYDSWPIDDMVALGNPALAEKTPDEVAAFILSGIADGLHKPERNTDTFRNNIVAPYTDEEGKISIIRNASALNTNHTMELVDRHKDIPVRTLVLWGIHDIWQTIRDGERLAREIPDAQLVRLEDASHWLQQDSPERFAREILLFLNAA